MLEQSLLEISGKKLSIGDIIQIAIFMMVLIGTAITIYYFFKDWARVRFTVDYSTTIQDGISSITGVSIFIKYTGRGSLLINEIGFLYRGGSRLLFAPGHILSEQQPWTGNISTRNNLEIIMNRELNDFVYYLETDTGKKYYSCNFAKRYELLGKFIM